MISLDYLWKLKQKLKNQFFSKFSWISKNPLKLQRNHAPSSCALNLSLKGFSIKLYYEISANENK